MKTLLILTCLIILGCSEDKTSEGVQDYFSTTVAKLEGGTWATSCMAILNGDAATEKQTVSFINGIYTETYTYYSDTCTTKTEEYKISGTYSIGGTLGAGNAALTLDKTWVNYSLIPSTTAAADSYNTMILCGLRNWAVGVAVNMLGRNCGGTTMPTVGSYRYDIFKISPFNANGFSTTGQLTFGLLDTVNNGSTPAKRPMYLMTSPVFIRQ